MPLLIFQSYQVDFDRELLYGLFRTLIASGLTYLLVIAFSELFVMTTLLSGITIPLLSVAAEFLLQLP